MGKMHNDAFIALIHYCYEERNRDGSYSSTSSAKHSEPINVFFLDGPDGGTTAALIEGGDIDPAQCYVANRHESSCLKLRKSGGGMLPDENVVHGTAAEVLTIGQPIIVSGKSSGKEDIDVAQLGEAGALSDIDFVVAYYFDGCGGLHHMLLV
jgi:hypothetical protein